MAICGKIVDYISGHKQFDVATAISNLKKILPKNISPFGTVKTDDQARFRRRSTHVPNLTDELSTVKEQRLNQFGTAGLVWCGKSVKFDRVSRTFVELNLGSTHGAPSESDARGGGGGRRPYETDGDARRLT